MRKTVMSLIWLLGVPLISAGQDGKLKVPSEVMPFVEKGTKAIARFISLLTCAECSVDFGLRRERATLQKIEITTLVGLCDVSGIKSTETPFVTWWAGPPFLPSSAKFGIA